MHPRRRHQRRQPFELLPLLGLYADPRLTERLNAVRAVKRLQHAYGH
jgi:hypothetical protein